MKTSAILMGALPVLSLGLGFGAGSFVGTPAPAAVPAVAEAIDDHAPEAADAAHATPADDAAPTDGPAVMAALTAAAGTRAPHGPDHATNHGSDQGAKHANGHGAAVVAAPVVASHDAGGAGAHGTGHGTAPADAAEVVRLGHMTIPVHKSNTITYVVADFGVSVDGPETAEHYAIAENATRLRDQILQAMTRAAERPVLRGAVIDSDELSRTIQSDLEGEFTDIDDVLFLSLYKQDVPRS